MWYPDATRNQAVTDGGAYASGYPWRIVVHTTESGSFSPSPSSYFGHKSYPHLTVHRDRVWQHIDTGRAARALARPSGSGPTNGACALQVEVVGYADRPWDSTTHATTARLVGWLRQQYGIPPTVLPAGPVPGSARADAPQRMSPAAWKSFHGVCGHRHVPWNSHYDPGAFDLGSLITEGDEMSAEGEARIEAMLGRINHQLDIKDGRPVNPGSLADILHQMNYHIVGDKGNLAKIASRPPVDLSALATAVAQAVTPQVEAAAARAAGTTTVTVDHEALVAAVTEALRTASNRAFGD